MVYCASSCSQTSELILQCGEGKLQIEGVLQQGALLKGKVPPGSQVSLLNRSVYTNEQGHFIFGLGRNAAATLDIRIKLADGSPEAVHTVAVKRRDYKIQRIDGVAQKYVSPPASVTERIKREAQQVRTARASFRQQADYLQGFKWPAIGRITGVYGSQRVFNGVPKRPHFGLDIAGPVGEPVYAPAGGVITFVNDDLYYSGGTIILDHGQGLSSTFIHLSKIHVELEQVVDQGEVIGEIGATGRVTGPSSRLEDELV